MTKGEVTKIVLTGGPCAGKTTGISIIEQKLTSLGYKVIVLEEMATSIINSGITPMDIGLPFQDMMMRLQLTRDEIYTDIAKRIAEKEDTHVVIIHDRGICEITAYCSKEDYIEIAQNLGFQENTIMNLYDGVFHLVTAADGAEEFYTTTNNTARTETPEQARELDAKTLNCWMGHPHLRVISNKNTNFDQKMKRLLTEIMSLLGEPIPLEIERKYLISMPNIEDLMKKYGASKSDIIQTYLTRLEDSTERRVRLRGVDGDFTYYYTLKSDVESATRSELERKISEKEYIKLLLEADTSKHQIRKTRYCFVYKERYFELDVYPFWNDKAILEIELSNRDEQFEIPHFISVISEVTNDKRYSNNSLADNLGIIE